MKTILTQDEYQNQFVDFYKQTLGTGIGTTVAMPGDDDSQDDGSVRRSPTVPDVGGGDAFNPMAGVSLTGGQPYNYSKINAGDYVKNNMKSAKASLDKSDGGFTDYLKNLAKDPATVPLTVAGVAMGLPLAPLGAVMGKLNKEQQYKNALAIASSGGGYIAEINGQTVSRAPGSRQYVGTMGDFSSEQLYALEELEKGFIPGTMVESLANPEDSRDGTYSTVGKEGLLDAATAKALSGNYDAYGNWHSTKFGTVSRSAPMDAAKALASQMGVNTAGWASTDFVNFSKSWKDTAAKPATSFSILGGFSNIKNSTMPEYQTAVETVKNAIKGYTPGGASGEDDSPPPPSKESAFDNNLQESISELGFDDSYDDDDDNNSGGDTSFSGSSPSPENVGFGGFDGREFATGGRIGMQTGGTAPAGFVQGPPGQFSDRETVADDQPMQVQEGTFVINAPAVEHAGSQDIRKMILDAYTIAREKGLDIGRVDRKIYESTVDVALSKGEVVVPPQLAKIIGYDRLEKINNRGKKEVSRRQQAAEGGFLGERQGYASGDKVTVYRGEPIDPDKAQSTIKYGYDDTNVGKFHTPSVDKARRYAVHGGPGNQQILSRKVTIDELFEGVEEAWKVNASKKNEYFAKMPKKELDKNVRFVRDMKKAYLAGERSLESMVFFLQEQVFHDDKSKVNFIETFKNDPKSAGKLAGRAISKVATKATPPLAILEMIGTVFAPTELGDGTLQGNESFLEMN